MLAVVYSLRSEKCLRPAIRMAREEGWSFGVYVYMYVCSEFVGMRGRGRDRVDDDWVERNGTEIGDEVLLVWRCDLR